VTNHRHEATKITKTHEEPFCAESFFVRLRVLCVFVADKDSHS